MIPYAEVIGDPIAHSKSPQLHRFWLAEARIAGDYRAVRVAPGELGDYFEARHGDAHWRGCNVTVPHKLAVLDHVEDPGGVADSIGAVNTVLRSPDGSIIGTNTDAAGFFAPIADLPLAGKAVAVVGSGGAARAMLFALARAEVGHVHLIARNALKGAALLARFGLRGDVVPFTAAVPAVALLANGSVLGMAGQPAYAPDLSALADDAVVYDAVYAPLETPLLAAARRAGLATIDGLEMLIGQAALAFELFFGVVPPRDRDAELRALLTS
jgi:shikimate dehydrogenase